MDGPLVRRFARESQEHVSGAFVRRVVPLEAGLLLELQAHGEAIELGLILTASAAWTWLLRGAPRPKLAVEIGALWPELVAPAPSLGWRDAEAAPLDALRAWLLRPEPSTSAWSRCIGSRLVTLEALGDDRVLRVEFEKQAAVGPPVRMEIIAELFDRGGNLLLKADSVELANRRGRPESVRRDDAGSTASTLAWSRERGVHSAAVSGLSLAAAAHLALAQPAALAVAQVRARGLRRDAGRLERRLTKLEAEAREAARAEHWRQDGELLAAQLHRVRRGATRITVEDLYTGGAPRDIDLDPKLSPQENVALYFKRARRAARGRDTITQRRDATRLELEDLRAAEATLPLDASWPEVLAAAADVFRAACCDAPSTSLATLWAAGGPAWRAGDQSPDAPGIVGRGRAGAEQALERDVQTGPGRRFLLPGGWEVRVGRSNAENDVLSHRFARPDDVWLHASGVAGSHVVLRMQGRSDNPPRDVLEAAAAIAARFSKAKHAGTVPVIWTRKRYVRKPRGGAPGLATCTHEKTIFVRPALPEAIEEN